MAFHPRAAETNGEEYISLARDAICCPMCEEPYKTAEPRTPCILPCFHTYCRHCLEESAKKDGAQSGGVCCPAFRAVCPTAVEVLPLNYALMTVVEAEHVSTGETRMECQECDVDAEATHFCQECSLLLCAVCGAHHDRSKKTKHHALLPATEFKERKQALPQGRRMCKKHKEQELQLYCNTCNTPICYDGTIKDHKGHGHELLTDVAEHHARELDKEAKQMSQVQGTLEAGIVRIKEEEASLKLEAAEQTTAVKQRFEQLVMVLREREEELTRDIEEARSRKSKVLKGQREGLEHAVASMASGSEHARRTVKLGDESEVMQWRVTIWESDAGRAATTCRCG